MSVYSAVLAKRLIAAQGSVLKQSVNFLKSHIIQTEILSLFVVFLIVANKLPYLNILLRISYTLPLFVWLASFLFGLAKKTMLIFTLFLFPVAYILTLSNNIGGAEEIGNAIFFLMCIISFLYGKEIWKESQKIS